MSRIALIIGAIGGFFAGVAAMLLINAIWIVPAAELRSRDIERASAAMATEKAIGELSNAADQARLRRRLCLERGGMYVHATGECRSK